MEQPPGHGSDVIEEVESSFHPVLIDGTGTSEYQEMGADLAGGAVGDAVVVEPIAA
jgi:hypothetical protein